MSVGSDFRFAWRALSKRRLTFFLGVVTVMLAVGVGTAIFSIVNAILFSPLPFQDPERLVMIWNVNEVEGFGLEQARASGRSMSRPELREWLNDSDVFEHMVGFSANVQVITNTESPELTHAYRTTPGVFRMLGAEPILGRGFVPEEEELGAEPVVVLRHNFWIRRYNGDLNILGEKLYLEGTPYTIVGVMPPEFVFFNRQSELLTPRPLRPASERDDRSNRNYRAMARLRDGMSLDQAQARADIFSEKLAEQYPETNRAWRVKLIPIGEDSAGEARPAMIVLFGAVLCVLLIMCSNVANLLLAQASSRGKELALRAALGATRWRLARQLLFESFLVAGVGGALSLGLSYGLIEMFRNYGPDRFGGAKYLLQMDQIGLDATVVVFALAASTLSALLFGCLPAWRATRPNLIEELKDVERGSTSGFKGRQVRSALVAAEVCFALVMVTAAALLAHSVLRLYDRGPGFSPERLLTVYLELAVTDDYEALRRAIPDRDERMDAWLARLVALNQEIRERLDALPEIESVASTRRLPLTRYYNIEDFTIEGRAPQWLQDEPSALPSMVSANFFQTLGVPLKSGRLFDTRDRVGGPWSIIINEEMAGRFWPNEDPVGQRIKSEDPPDAVSPWLTVVGVVGNIPQVGMDWDAIPVVYVSDQQVGLVQLYLLIKTRGEPLDALPAVRHALAELHPDSPLYQIRTFDDVMRQSAWKLYYSMALLSGLAILALTLAAVGIYGVLNFSVRERTQEIGVRMALGASASQVRRMVLGQGVRLIAYGVVLGALLALALTRYLASLLYGVESWDPPTYAAAAVTLLAAGAAASYFPALRATRVEPIKALRHD